MTQWQTKSACLAAATVLAWSSATALSAPPARPADWTKVGASTLVFSPDGTTLATSFYSGDTYVHLWDAATGKLRHRLEGHTKEPTSLAFTADGKRLASLGGVEGVVRVWDVASGKQLAQFDDKGSQLAFARDGRLATIGDRLRIWDVDKKTIVAEIPTAPVPKFKAKITPTAQHDALAWSVDGTSIAALTDWFGMVPNVNGEERATMEHHHQITLFDVAGKKVAQHWEDENGPKTLSFSSDNRTVATTSGLKTTLWEAATGKPRHLLDHQGYAMINTAGVAFSPSGKHVAATHAHGGVIVWNVESGKQVAKFKELHGYPPLFMFLNDDTIRAAASNFSSIRAWEFDVKNQTAKPLGAQ